MLLAYTICFCRCNDKVLMLYRYKLPNQGLWNGLGGKIQADETPLESVQREVMEEADIDLRKAERFHFAGIVTWPSHVDPTSASKGMYAFMADFAPGSVTWVGERANAEGLLCWQPTEWVCDPENTAVVSNIPRFLPGMITQGEPVEYYCDYREGRLVDVVVRALPEDWGL